MNRRCTVDLDAPKHGGRCRQAQPLVSTYTIPANTASSSMFAVPPLFGHPRGGGSNGATISRKPSGTIQSQPPLPRSTITWDPVYILRSDARHSGPGALSQLLDAGNLGPEISHENSRRVTHVHQRRRWASGLGGGARLDVSHHPLTDRPSRTTPVP